MNTQSPMTFDSVSSHPLSPPLPPDLAALQHLIQVVAQLRNPEGGCPWDLEQTPQSLMPYVLEEAYEVVDAIRQGEPEAIADELGDLLLQVVLQAQIAREAGQFDLATVATRITEKLIRRHPHVFSDVTVSSVEEVHQNWEQIKTAEEQSASGSPSPSGESDGESDGESGAAAAQLSPRLQRYARSLPPLTAALKISTKVAAVGFEWDSIEGVWDKLREEIHELQQALAEEPKANQEAELGDVLFTLVNLARWADLDPAEALASTNHRFIQRFSHVEQVTNRSIATYSQDELETLWQQAKATLKEEQV